MQLETLFDVPFEQRQQKEWQVRLPLDEREWNVGLIVGPSGAGKSSVARAAFGDRMVDSFEWSSTAALIDNFDKSMSVKTVVRLLGSVGLNSPPSWMRPFGTLSTGEQFRATVARALAELPDLAVIDEFTSTVDRAVAQRASSTIAKTVRKNNQQFVAVTCHYDVVDWLQPDWIYQPHTGEFQWRHLHPRPRVELDFCEIDRKAWSLFKQHHYLSSEQSSAAHAFGAFHNGEIVGYISYIHFPHPKTRNLKHIHRVVVLPDWEGLGIGMMLVNECAKYLAQRGYRCGIITTHPAMVHALAASKRWQMRNKPQNQRERQVSSGDNQLRKRFADPRRLMTYSFEYRPPIEGVAADTTKG